MASGALIDSSPALRRLILLIALAFALLVALGIHGFSLPLWHAIIDGSATDEILLGKPRGIRTDDFSVHLPLVFAQAAHDPAFPLVNENIGLGHNMLVPIPVPIAHALSLFRPTLWGFFITNDTGLAWMWWSRALGLFTVWMLVFLVVSKGRLALSCAAALLLLVSPFFQFWSLNAAGLTAFMGVAFLATCALATSKRPIGIIASGIVLGWAGGCFALSLYPPYQVGLGYLYLLLVGSFLWERRRLLPLREHLGFRALSAALALFIVGGALLTFFFEAGEAVALMRQTIYPGKNALTTGGDVTLWKLLNGNLWIPLQVTEYGPLYNICEAAGFWLLFPPIAAGVLWSGVKRHERADPLAVALVVYGAFLIGYCVLGIPGFLARATLVGQMAAGRAVLPLGLADALLLVRFLSGAGEPVGRAASLLLAGLWLLLLAIVGWYLHAALPETILAVLISAVLANALLAYLALRRRSPGALVAALGVGMLACTAWFNPVVSGGGDYLADNPLSRKILEIDRQMEGESVWISYQNSYRSLPNLFRAIGVRAIDGANPLPQLALWERLDPSAQARSIYNRYAHVHFKPQEAKEATFRLSSLDSFVVALDPAADELEKLGVTHLLVRIGPGSRWRKFWSRYEPLAWVGSNAIFALPLLPRTTLDDPSESDP